MVLLIISGFVLAATGGVTLAWQISGLSRERRAARRASRTLNEEARLAEAPFQETHVKLEQAAEGFIAEQRDERLRQVPIEALKQSGASNVRWSALEAADVQTLGDLKGLTARGLKALPGVGKVSAQRLLDAARGVRKRMRAEPPRLPGRELDEAGSGDLVDSARRVMLARDTLGEVIATLQGERDDVTSDLNSIEAATGILRWLTAQPGQTEEARAAAGALVERVERLADPGGAFSESRRLRTILAGSVGESLTHQELAEDYQRRHADYSSLLEGYLAPDGEASPAVRQPSAQGGIPEEIARRVEAFGLRADAMRVTLRRYQKFGASYLLVQERTVLGDEMGLGKTIQALAAFVHLEAEGSGRRFLVVSPASITRNWLREAVQRTNLSGYLLQGGDWSDELALWIEGGGLAVTSYSTCRSGEISRALRAAGATVDFLVVDEAHYAKNPDSGRTRAVVELSSASEHVCLMTGTPLENKLEDFKNLVTIADSKLAQRMPAMDPGIAAGTGATSALQRLVAPVYLRRNQRDVLSELPERIEKEEWVDLGPGDAAAYGAAVTERNYMAMRRAATISDGKSAKLERLGQLLDEYREEGRKVLVFSFFLDVLNVVGEYFDCMGPIIGAVPAKKRMDILDGFRDAKGHHILLSQIEAGGVGVNIQAASVVVLMEPQWKPSTEDQAIARAHRMGQTEHVVVHRLLARDCVDERLVEVLQGKRAIFEDYARKSAVKEASVEATESGFARAIIDAELARLRPSG